MRWQWADPRRYGRIPQALVWSVFVMLVLALVRRPVYELLAGSAESSPGVVRRGLEVLPEAGLVVLAAGFGIAWWRASELRTRSIGLTAAPACVLAYGLSELLKVLVDEARPCRTLGQVSTIAHCPVPGDWSWPSNHATIAAALATATVLLVPKAWRFVVPLAVAVALCRVAIGVHYPHDVIAGLLLGSVVVATVTVGLSPRVYRTMCAVQPVVRKW